MHLRDCNTAIRKLLGNGLSKSVHLPEQVPIDIARENSRIVDKYISDSRKESRLSISIPSLHHAASRILDSQSYVEGHIVDASGQTFSTIKRLLLPNCHGRIHLLSKKAKRAYLPSSHISSMRVWLTDM